MDMKRSLSKNIEEVFLSEALGHASACDVVLPADKKMLARKGSMIIPRTIARLAAEGIDRIFVYRKPRVSVIIVGDGLIAPGGALSPGRSYDFGSAALKAALDMMRIRPVFMRCLPGESKALDKVVSFALDQSDIVILVVKEVKQGIREVRKFLKGSKKQVFCLSYDSDQIFECFDKFIQPAIRAFMGCTSSEESACGMN